MPDSHTWIAFTLVALGMALSPGPNMIHLVSRALCQGRRAAMYSLAGVALGFLIWMLATSFGLTALLTQMPKLFVLLRYVGASYLLYLAFMMLRPGGRSPFQVKQLQSLPARQLFTAGLLTNLFNPKIALVYLSLLPQFIGQTQGSGLTQSLLLGGTQVVMGTCVNGAIALSAGTIAQRWVVSPRWQVRQKWLMSSVFCGLAIRLVVRK
ncbi:MAG: LysE family translocator [Steroidobacteraceae bacterium]